MEIKNGKMFLNCNWLIFIFYFYFFLNPCISCKLLPCPVVICPVVWHKVMSFWTMHPPRHNPACLKVIVFFFLIIINRIQREVTHKEESVRQKKTLINLQCNVWGWETVLVFDCDMERFLFDLRLCEESRWILFKLHFSFCSLLFIQGS